MLGILSGYDDRLLQVEIDPASGWKQWLAAHVLAAAEQQGGPVGIGVALDVPNEDDAIAAVMPTLVAALEMGGGVSGAYVAILNRLVIEAQGPPHGI
jgi:hypothetical protein